MSTQQIQFNGETFTVAAHAPALTAETMLQRSKRLASVDLHSVKARPKRPKPEPVDLGPVKKGRRFHSLVVKSETKRRADSNAPYVGVRCDCGRSMNCNPDTLRYGRKKACSPCEASLAAGRIITPYKRPRKY